MNVTIDKSTKAQSNKILHLVDDILVLSLNKSHMNGKWSLVIWMIFSSWWRSGWTMSSICAMFFIFFIPRSSRESSRSLCVTSLHLILQHKSSVFSRASIFITNLFLDSLKGHQKIATTSPYLQHLTCSTLVHIFAFKYPFEIEWEASPSTNGSILKHEGNTITSHSKSYFLP